MSRVKIQLSDLPEKFKLRDTCLDHRFWNYHDDHPAVIEVIANWMLDELETNQEVTAPGSAIGGPRRLELTVAGEGSGFNQSYAVFYARMIPLEWEELANTYEQRKRRIKGDPCRMCSTFLAPDSKPPFCPGQMRSWELAQQIGLDPAKDYQPSMYETLLAVLVEMLGDKADPAYLREIAIRQVQQVKNL